MRGRLTARARLTAVFLGLFIVFGAALTVVNYALLEAQLPRPAMSGSSASIGATAAASLVEADSGSVTGTGNGPLQSDGAGPPSPAEISLSVVQAIGSYRSDALDSLLRISLLSLLGAALLAGLAAWLVSRRVLRPLGRMSETARHITERNLDERLPLTRQRDELRDLGETINGTLDRLAAALAHERRLVANASHELRTPIANQRVTLDVALHDPDASVRSLREACEVSLQQNYRSEALVNGMLAMARADQGRLDTGPVSLDRLVRRVLDETDTGRLRVTTRLDPATVAADPFLAERLVANLIANAVGHNSSGDGSVDICLRSGEAGTELIVANSCRPIHAGQLARIREPFRRAADDRTDSHSGAGLGLSIVDTIARAHGWTLTLSTVDPARFTASVVIPAA